MHHHTVIGGYHSFLASHERTAKGFHSANDKLEICCDERVSARLHLIYNVKQVRCRSQHLIGWLTHAKSRAGDSLWGMHELRCDRRLVHSRTNCNVVPGRWHPTAVKQQTQVHLSYQLCTFAALRPAFAWVSSTLYDHLPYVHLQLLSGAQTSNQLASCTATGEAASKGHRHYVERFLLDCLERGSYMRHCFLRPFSVPTCIFLLRFTSPRHCHDPDCGSHTPTTTSLQPPPLFDAFRVVIIAVASLVASTTAGTAAHCMQPTMLGSRLLQHTAVQALLAAICKMGRKLSRC